MITLTAKITLADETVYDIDKRNLLSLDTTIVDRSDITMPSWGIISNRGNIRFVDYNGKINHLVELNALQDKQKCSLYLTDTLNGTQALVGELYATKWDYDTNSKQVSVTLQDELIEWQDISFAGLIMSAEELTAMEYIGILQDWYIPKKYSFAPFDPKTTTILQEYKIKHAYLKKSSLWGTLNKFCEMLGLHIFKNFKNKIVISYDFRD